MLTKKIILSFLLFLIIAYSCKEKEPIRTIPVVELLSVNGISDTSFNCTSRIVSDGNNEIVEKGICWSTNKRPVLSMNSTKEGGGNADFDSRIDGLIQTGVYYVRPYVTTNVGTTYGDVVQFQTKEGDGKHVIDYDGNIYNTLVIGDQTWLTENSYSTHFQNGVAVYSKKKSAYLDDHGLEKLFADNNLKNVEDFSYYGETFTWEKLIDERNICPKGWHAATNDDWLQLIQNLGGAKIAGGKMKEEGVENWHTPQCRGNDRKWLHSLAKWL